MRRKSKGLPARKPSGMPPILQGGDGYGPQRVSGMANPNDPPSMRGKGRHRTGVGRSAKQRTGKTRAYVGP